MAPASARRSSADALTEIEADGSACADTVVAQVGEVSAEEEQSVADSTFEIVDETEDTASVSATKPDGSEQTFDLVNEDGAWKMSARADPRHAAPPRPDQDSKLGPLTYRLRARRSRSVDGERLTAPTSTRAHGPR